MLAKISKKKKKRTLLRYFYLPSIHSLMNSSHILMESTVPLPLLCQETSRTYRIKKDWYLHWRIFCVRSLRLTFLTWLSESFIAGERYTFSVYACTPGAPLLLEKRLGYVEEQGEAKMSPLLISAHTFYSPPHQGLSSFQPQLGL